VILKEAKLCPKFMRKDITEEMRNEKKHYYSCKSQTCVFHMWLCAKHPAVNKEQMEKFEEQLRTRSGIRLFFMASKKKVRNRAPYPSENFVPSPQLPAPIMTRG
jgi:hypothetical protein